MSRIGNLKPIDIQTPHGSVRILSKYRADKRCYRLVLYGPFQGVQWMLPKRDVVAMPSGMAQVEVSRPERPITTIPALDQFCRELVYRWEERFDLGPDDPALIHLDSKGLTVATNVPSTLGALITQFLSAQKAHVRSKTLFDYTKALDLWQKMIPASTPLTAITADMIRMGMQRLNTKMKAVSVNSYFRPLKICLNYAVTSGFLRDPPHRGIKALKVIKGEPKWWSPPEMAKVLAAAQADTRAPEDASLLFALALYLGLRKGEIDRMKWTDLTLDGAEPVACVRSTEDGMTKSGHTRHIPICEELRVILLRHRKPTGFVLRDTRTERGLWHYRFEARELFARVVKAAGVTPIRFHDMRHTFASQMLGKGAPVFKVAKWLGHSDSRITEQVYAHLLTYDPEINIMNLGTQKCG